MPENEVFKREDIGHALAAPTPEAGHTTPSLANAPEDDGQWRMPSKNYASTRFSNLKEITPENIKALKPDFSFSLAVNKGQEAAPIVADNMMYIVTAYPNIVYALDLTKPGAPLNGHLPQNPLRRAKALPAATSSIVAARSTMASTSSTRSTDRPLQWTSRRASRCGALNWAISIAARP